MSKPKKTKDEKIKTAVTAVVVGILVVFFLTGACVGGFWLSRIQGVTPPYTPNPSAVEEPADAGEAARTLRACLDLGLEQGPRCVVSPEISDVAVSLPEGNDLLNRIAGQRAERVRDALKSTRAETVCDYFVLTPETLSPLSADAEVISGFHSEYTHYRCSNCGALYDEYHEYCDVCNGDRKIGLQDDYRITLALSESGKEAARRAELPEAADYAALIAREAEGCFELTGELALTRTSPEIVFTVARSTGRLKNASFSVRTELQGKIRFQPPYEAYGEQLFTAAFTESLDFSFLWAGVRMPDEDDRFAGNNISVPSGSTKRIKAEPVPNDPLLYETKLSWAVSDESLCSVTEDGYLKAKKNYGTVTLTATMEFEGRSFTDTAEVTVRKNVTLLILNHYRLKMKPDDTRTLRVFFYPAAAKGQPVIWSSDRPDIADVDENGLVTAKSSGTAEISALSDDGYTKVTCRVEVKP